MTAHHQDDQAETVLLQMLRGGGPEGLAAMPKRMRFGAGSLLRPLLEVRACTSNFSLDDSELNIWMTQPMMIRGATAITCGGR